MSREPSVAKLDNAECFAVYDGKGEWAFFALHDAGWFVAESSFGTFTYSWTHRGGETLKQFVAGCDYGYFFGKVAASRGVVFSAEKTVTGIRETIIERRREREITKDEAREFWSDCDAIVDYRNEGEFFAELGWRSTLCSVILDNDFGGLARTVRDPQCVGFWEKLWPLFLAEIATPTHADDIAVDTFAAAMKAKLAEKRAKGFGGWPTDTREDTSRWLREHVEKGDPVDVANFAMMLHQRGEKIAADEKTRPVEIAA